MDIRFFFLFCDFLALDRLQRSGETNLGGRLKQLLRTRNHTRHIFLLLLMNNTFCIIKLMLFQVCILHKSIAGRYLPAVDL